MENESPFRYDIFSVNFSHKFSPSTKVLEKLLNQAETLKIEWKDNSWVVFRTSSEGEDNLQFIPELGDYGYSKDFFIKPKNYNIESVKELLRFCSKYEIDYGSNKPVIPDDIDLQVINIIDYDRLIDIVQEKGLIDVEISPSFFKLHDRRFRFRDPPTSFKNYDWIDIDFIGTPLGEEVLEYLKLLCE